MRKKTIFSTSLFLLITIVISGCSQFLGEGRQVEEMVNLVETSVAQTMAFQESVETIVAQTVTAMPTNPEQETGQETPSATVFPTATADPTFTPTLPATATQTPELSVPVAEVSISTNCRTGPGKIYDLVSVLVVGKQAEVIGRNVESDYWIIKTPGGSGHCWLWGKYATVKGPTADLPRYDVPPTPTPSITRTGTPDLVTVSVSVDTNCRTGPGKIYDKVSILRIGKTARVVARNAAGDYWVIENPEGDGNCWLWGKYATVSGPSGSLPVWDTPPTPTAATVSLSVSVDTNCRTGPGKAYTIVTILRAGKTAVVLGRNAASTYWVIENPAGSGSCWVWGRYAVLAGPISSMPVLDPPATPTPTLTPTPKP